MNGAEWGALITAVVALIGAATSYLRSVIAHQTSVNTANNLTQHLQSQIPTPTSSEKGP